MSKTDGLMDILKRNGNDVKNINEAAKDENLMKLLTDEFGTDWNTYLHFIDVKENAIKARDKFESESREARDKRIEKHKADEDAKSKALKDAEVAEAKAMAKLSLYNEKRQAYETKKQEERDEIQEMHKGYWEKYWKLNDRISEAEKDIQCVKKNLIAKSKHHWHANVHILRGYGDSYSFYKEMIGWLRETFPNVKDKDITIGKITKSHSVQGFALVAFTLYLPKRKAFKGWEEYEDGIDNHGPEYCWA